MKRVLLIYIHSFLLLTVIIGQQPYVQVVSEEKHFGHATVNMLMEDHQGIIWAGTHLGLLRFDGLQTTVYLPEKGNPNSLSSEFVYYLYEDRQHNIWVATRNGLNKLDPSRKHFTRFKSDTGDPETIPNNRIFGLLPDSDSTFFLLCDNSELASFNMRTGKVLRLNPGMPSGTSSDAEKWPTRAYKIPNGKVLVGTRRGLFEYDRAMNVLKEIEDMYTTGDSLWSINGYRYGCRDGSIWFVDKDGGLFKWIPGLSLQKFSQPALVTALGDGIMRLQDYNHSQILISTRTAYLLVDKMTGQMETMRFRADQHDLLQYDFALPDHFSYCIETRDGIVVMGTFKGDLFLINPLLQQFSFKNILMPDEISGIQLQNNIGHCFDDVTFQKRYISVIYDTLFYIEDLSDGSIIGVDKETSSNIETKWMLDHAGRLWLCNGKAILEVDRMHHTIKSYAPEIPAYNLFAMVEVSPGRMLVGSFQEGLYWFEPDRKIFRKLPLEKGLIRTQVFSLKADPIHDVVWIGTVRNGLLKYDITRDTFIHYINDTHNSGSIGGDWVRDIAIDSTGDVWFATDPIGLSRYDYQSHPDSAFTNLTMEDGLPSNFIAGIGVDQDGFIWMTSLRGIARLDPETIDVKLYGGADGLPATRFSRANLIMSSQGYALVGTQTGYLYFHPDSMATNTKPPALLLSDVLVFEQSVMKKDGSDRVLPIQLSHKENYLTIQFSVINYTVSERNTVRYRMDGLEEQWHTRSGIHQVSYTNIPPGEYVFRIMAANNDGVWNETESNIPIVIRPPFWQRTWFYLLLATMTAAIIGILYHYKLSQSIKENRILAEKETFKAETEKKLAQLEMTALRAQMNPHFIFNCLNSINRFIIINDNEAASSYLTKFAKLIRQVLDNSRGEKIAFSAELETLQLYIDMESLRFADKFEYTIDVDKSLWDQPYCIQPMLIQPYVENAIWHGLMHRKSKGKLGIRFLRKEDTLQVEIEDNGVGREMAQQIKAIQLVRKQSHGMKVTAERMSLLSKKLQVPVKAHVEDLHDEDLQASGTRVILTLPLELSPGDSDTPKMPAS